MDLEAAVAAIDEFALRVEEREDEAPVTIDADGASCKPFRLFHPIRGGAASFTILWNPVASSVIHVTNDGGRSVVRSGTIDVDGELDASEFAWNRLLAAARRWIESAYDDSREKVSRWVFNLAAAGASTLFDEYGTGAIMVDDERTVDSEQVMEVLASLGAGVEN